MLLNNVLKIQYLFIYILLFYGCTVNYFLFFGVSLANDTRRMVLNKKQQWCTWILLFKWKKTFAWDSARAVYTIRQIVNMETVCGNEISPSANTCLFFLNRLSSCSNFILVWHAFIYFQSLGFLIAEEPILKYSQLSYTEFTLHHLGMFCIILIFLLSPLC